MTLEILASQRLLSYPRDKVRAEGMIDGEPLAEVGVQPRPWFVHPIRCKPKLEIDLNLFTGDRSRARGAVAQRHGRGLQRAG